MMLGLLLAIPVGILADRIGRRPLLLLGFSSFAIRHLWIQIVCKSEERIPSVGLILTVFARLVLAVSRHSSQLAFSTTRYHGRFIARSVCTGLRCHL